MLHAGELIQFLIVVRSNVDNKLKTSQTNLTASLKCKMHDISWKEMQELHGDSEHLGGLNALWATHFTRWVGHGLAHPVPPNGLRLTQVNNTFEATVSS